jgi:aldehyde dehydrogenase (NAD+)
MRIANEEVFGPLLALIPFDNEDQAVRIANSTIYGLAAGVWTSSIRRALTMSEKLEAGTVWVNCYRVTSYMTPFGGYKRSGFAEKAGSKHCGSICKRRASGSTSKEKLRIRSGCGKRINRG